jgi:hypothetical protein
MKPWRIFAVVAFGTLVALAGAPALADLASNFGVYVYPTQGQTPTQQAAAESACYSSAENRTGVNPSAPPPAPAPAPTSRGGLFRGGAHGAAAGAAIGAIAGNAGEGAAIGAVAGGLFGVRRQSAENEQASQNAQSFANAEYQGDMNNFRTAFSACMSAKGYVAR